jgi:hypothetical protein
MDQATQQNAALVEESAAAAGSLKGQAEQLVQSVAFFQLAGGSAQASAARAIAVAAARPVAAAPLHARAPAVSVATRAAPVLPSGSGTHATVATVAPPVRKPVAANSAAASKDDDWESF